MGMSSVRSAPFHATCWTLFLSSLLLAMHTDAQTFTIVGTQGTESAINSGPNPFAVGPSPNTRGSRQQYIIRGQELIDAGIPAGAQILSVGFNVTTAASGTAASLPDFAVTVYANSSSATTSPLSSWVTTNQLAASTPAAMNVGTTGWKDMGFAPFQWTGGATNNLIVQTCYGSSISLSNANHALVQRTTNLSNPPAGVIRGRWLFSSATSAHCTNTSTPTTSIYLRPLVRIGWQNPIPVPGNTLASVTTVVCGGTMLSLQNPSVDVTYQWQSSPDNGTWTDISGATSATYAATPSTATWYRCMVTGPGGSANSTPVQVTVAAPAPGTTTGPNTVHCEPALLGIQLAQPGGVTYQWEASTNGDIETEYASTGNTLPTYTATLAVPTWYRCRVSCPTTGLSANSTSLLVTPGPVPDAGENAALTICADAPPQDLFALLGVNAQPDGNWSGPSPVIAGLFDPATMAPGTYTYTVQGTGACPDANSIVTVTIASCLGVSDHEAHTTVHWLGQTTDGTHLVDIQGVPVLAWVVVDAAGRTMHASTGPVQEQFLHLPLGLAPAGIYVVRLFTGYGSATLRLVHATL